jgi:hypothetical protein
MKQRASWKANSSSASQEILRNHKTPPPDPIMIHIDPVHKPHPTSLRSILILSSHPRLGLPSGLLPSGFPTKTLYASLLSHLRATCPVHFSLHFNTRTMSGEEYKAPRYVVFSTPLLHRPPYAQISSSSVADINNFQANFSHRFTACYCVSV